MPSGESGMIRVSFDVGTTLVTDNDSAQIVAAAMVGKEGA